MPTNLGLAPQTLTLEQTLTLRMVAEGPWQLAAGSDQPGGHAWWVSADGICAGNLERPVDFPPMDHDPRPATVQALVRREAMTLAPDVRDGAGYGAFRGVVTPHGVTLLAAARTTFADKLAYHDRITAYWIDWQRLTARRRQAMAAQDRAISDLLAYVRTCATTQTAIAPDDPRVTALCLADSELSAIIAAMNAHGR